MGIGKFLDGTARTYRYVLGDAARLPSKVTALLRQYLTSGDHAASDKLPPFDFADVGKLLLGTGSQAQSDAIHAGITDPALAGGVVNVASRIIAYLQPLYPHRVRVTMTGPVDGRPSDQDVARFRRVYQVADDPLLVLRDLNEGALSRGQVRSLQQLYPELYALIGDVAANTLVNVKSGRGKGWTLPRRKEQGLRMLLGADSPGSLRLAEYQRTFQEPQKEPSGARAPDVDSTKLLTPGQQHG